MICAPPATFRRKPTLPLVSPAAALGRPTPARGGSTRKLSNRAGLTRVGYGSGEGAWLKPTPPTNGAEGRGHATSGSGALSEGAGPPGAGEKAKAVGAEPGQRWRRWQMARRCTLTREASGTRHSGTGDSGMLAAQETAQVPKGRGGPREETSRGDLARETRARTGLGCARTCPLPAPRGRDAWSLRPRSSPEAVSSDQVPAPAGYMDRQVSGPGNGRELWACERDRQWRQRRGSGNEVGGRHAGGGARRAVRPSDLPFLRGGHNQRVLTQPVGPLRRPRP